jgi:hypothetical protein
MAMALEFFLFMVTMAMVYVGHAKEQPDQLMKE